MKEVWPVSSLIYTSSQDRTGRSGWQVKESAGDAVLLRELQDHTRASLQPVHRMPLFPTAAERDLFPRRLEHRLILGLNSGLWHTVEAGKDASGRPGNVFVTAVALSPVDTREHHAIDFWRSEYWPAPFGAEEVLRTGLPDAPLTEKIGPPHDSPETEEPRSGPDRVLEFMYPGFPEPYRRGLLFQLLDAVEAAVEGDGPRLALLTPDQDEAADWIAAICAWTVPAWTRRFAWSTWERGQDLANPRLAALHLVCCPEQDAEAAHASGRRVFNPTEETAPAEEVFAERHPSGEPTTWGAEAAHASDQGTERIRQVLGELRDRAREWDDCDRPHRPLHDIRLGIQNLPALPEPTQEAQYTEHVLQDVHMLTAAVPPEARRLADDDPQRERLSKLARDEMERADDRIARAPAPEYAAFHLLRLLAFARKSNLDLGPQKPEHLDRMLANPAQREAIQAQGTIGWDEMWDRIEERYPARSDGPARASAGHAPADPTPEPDVRPRTLQPGASAPRPGSPTDDIDGFTRPSHQPAPPAHGQEYLEGVRPQALIDQAERMTGEVVRKGQLAEQANLAGIEASRRAAHQPGGGQIAEHERVLADRALELGKQAQEAEARACGQAGRLLGRAGLRTDADFFAFLDGINADIRVALAQTVVLALAPQDSEETSANQTHRLPPGSLVLLLHAADILLPKKRLSGVLQRDREKSGRDLVKAFDLEILFAALRLEGIARDNEYARSVATRLRPELTPVPDDARATIESMLEQRELAIPVGSSPAGDAILAIMNKGGEG